jgi:molybdenum cofactor biosynthesis protein MoaC
METTRPFQPLEDNSSFKMVSVSEKPATPRRAIAQGKIILTREAFQAICEKSNPKGDVLAQAEIAGILAAKNTSNLIPLCHPLPIEQILVRFVMSPEDSSITSICEVRTTAKTGVEMEALSGVNGSLLAIYDLSKILTPELVITDIYLKLKEGGKSGHWTHPLHEPKAQSTPASSSLPLQDICASVLTISDRCSRGEAEDFSGPAAEVALQALGAQVKGRQMVADDIDAIRATVFEMTRSLEYRLLVTTGGTGVSPRDVTPEALETLWTKPIPGIGEMLRSHGSRYTQYSWLSRSTGGLIGETLVIALPGKPSAVREGIEILKNHLPHLCHIAQGGRH